MYLDDGCNFLSSLHVGFVFGGNGTFPVCLAAFSIFICKFKIY